MASTFKTLLGDDVVNTRTMLHEAIPITGTISSGTYADSNIKTFGHGMFESIYDYPYLSSSANHIFDITYGHSSVASSSLHAQNNKKSNIYNQMAQVLMGYNVSGNIRNFDSDGLLDDNSGSMNQCFFVNYSRLLVKDEIKKNSFRLTIYSSGSNVAVTSPLVLGDYKSANQFRTSPAGDYGLIFSSSAAADATVANSTSVGLIFYQAGIVVLSSSIFTDTSAPASGIQEFGPIIGMTGASTSSIHAAQSTGSIEQLADGLRNRIKDINFNNTIELNSTIYFCRVNHNEFNYSSNPTYVSGSKLVVKNNVNDLPLTYITTIGLYSSDNEMLAVAKLSEPIRKDPNTELTLRVRLDY